MATCREIDLSRDFDESANSTSMSTVWIVEGETNEQAAYDLVRSRAPLHFGKLVRNRIRGSYKGGGCWLVDVEYGTINPNSAPGVTPQDPTEPGELDPLDPTQPPPGTPAGGTSNEAGLQKFDISFDLSGGTMRITQSILTRHAVRRGGGTAADHKRAIGVGKDGSVEGCEIAVPQLSFTVGATRPASKVNLKYIRLLGKLTAKTNDRPWWGFKEGEVLYLGASGQFVGDGRWSISHKFSAGDNWDGEVVTTKGTKPGDPRLTICEGLTLPSKRAWDHLWVTYEDKLDPASGTLARVPLDAYMEVVYGEADFRNIGLGGK